MREAERCPICGTKSNWVTDVHCYCMKCYVEFNPKTQVAYEINAKGVLKRVENMQKTNNNQKEVAKNKENALRKIETRRKNKGSLVLGLKYLRLKNNLSVAELAQETGQPQSAITKWELCNKGMSQKNLELFSSVLGVSIDELLKEYSKAEIDEVEYKFKENKLKERFFKTDKTASIIKQLRLRNNMSQVEFGRRIHRSSTYVWHLETDPSRFLNFFPEEQQRIAKVLNVDLEELISEIRKEMEK